ncbi:MAG: glycosyltransferase family 2 protein [Algicola sp.]|nr:glycosyltransferase family 2 protein [Algicola sp.]
MKLVTVFTPTYNRAYCLEKLYISLKGQSSNDFKWLIIDDGSSDNTKDLVKTWISQGDVDITYVSKENGGMHTAHNVAYRTIDTELNVCVDSDDCMPLNAIESIKNTWLKVRSNEELAGLIGLDEDTKGSLIGKGFSEEGVPITLDEYYHKQKGKGDKKLVLRTSITSAYPKYPEYSGEKLVPLSSLYTLICRDFKLYPVNDVWVTVDYQPTGSSATIISQYFRSPKGFRYARVLSMNYSTSTYLKLTSAIHYNISNLILREFVKIFNNSFFYITIPLLPLSVFFYCYLALKLKKK